MPIARPAIPRAATDDLAGFRRPATRTPSRLPGKKVIVTGCYDWFHSGHVRFFEEVSALGDLYVVVGHDANIRLLKGEGHPLFPEHERRYMVQSDPLRQAGPDLHRQAGWTPSRRSSGSGRDIYAVNEDGDRPEKRQYCEAHGIEYRVLKRLPKEGLPRQAKHGPAGLLKG